MLSEMTSSWQKGGCSHGEFTCGQEEKFCEVDIIGCDVDYTDGIRLTISITKTNMTFLSMFQL